VTIRSFNTRNLSAAGIDRRISICTFSAAGWVSLGGNGIAFSMYHTIYPQASVVGGVPYSNRCIAAGALGKYCAGCYPAQLVAKAQLNPVLARVLRDGVF
jgi:hypothetical protein